MIRTLIMLLISWQFVLAQNKSSIYKKSVFQLGLFPGFSTNGLNPGEYDNSFSLNVFTGFSHSTKRFELNGLAGFNTASSSGIHISGIANFIGGNGQVGLSEKQKRLERRIGYETNLTGFQFSGALNYVGTNAFGSQLAFGVNRVSNYLMGFQFGGLFNYVGGFTMGVQLSGIGNYSKKSMSGVQLAFLLNATNGSCSGIQLGGFNSAGLIFPIRGPMARGNTAFQMGIINKSGDMGGWQIGIINIGDRVAGSQIGIINIFKNSKDVDYTDGPAYGLFNFGSYLNPRVYSSNLFLINYGIYTGKALNSRIKSANRTIYSYNEMIYSSNYALSSEVSWGVSYRFGIISFYKSVDSSNQRNFFSLSGELGHYNKSKKRDDQLNMRYAVHAEMGFKLSKKANFIYPFVGISYNYMPNGDISISEFLATTTNVGKLWPGYSIGVMFH